MPSRAFLEESLKVLSLCGLHSLEKTVFSYFRLALAGILIHFVLFECFLWCIWLWDGLDSIEGLTSFVGAYIATIKYYTLVVQGKKISTLLTKIEYFWNIDKFGSKLENKINRIFSILRKTMFGLIGMLLCLIAVYLFQPITSRDRKLPMHFYHPVDKNQSPQYEIIYSIQICEMLMGGAVVLGYDGLFISLIVTIVCELKMIKKSFEIIPFDYNIIKGDSKRTLKELYKIVDHHNLILGCIKDISEIYSLPLLNIYCSFTIALCAAMFGLISSGVPPSQEALNKYGMYVLFFDLQLFFYCAAGSELTEESLSVAAAAYGTEWYIQTQPEFRRALTMIIQRATKLELLTIGGMFFLNLEAYTTVIKCTLSFFSVVQALYNADNR